jgi:hypothetical protein
MLKSFSDKRKGLFTIVASQLSNYAVSYYLGSLKIRDEKTNIVYLEVEKGNIKIVHNKGVTYLKSL